jgi:SAM-dependent methyltransferase
MFAWRRALQFAPDSSLDESWFRTFEGSEYGGENSIDMQSIDRPDSIFDFISLSLVLEFVPDDRQAFSELLRVGSDDLILHITFNSGLTGDESTHSEEPSGEYGVYHDYGRDFEERFEAAERGLSTLTFEVPDPVTGDATYPFTFICRRRNDAETLAAAFEAEPAASVRSFTPVPA